MCAFWGGELELNVLFIWRFVGWLYSFALLKTCPFTEGIHSDKCVCVAVWTLHYRFNKTCLVRIGCFCFSLIGYSNSPSLSFFVFVAVMRRNPFAAEGCCRKGSRNALQELYNPTQVAVCHNIYVAYSETRWQCLEKEYGDNEFIIIYLFINHGQSGDVYTTPFF